jgi:hypothetical protein
MDCTLCGSPTNQIDAERRDLGGDGPEFVCPACQDLADDVAGDSETGGQDTEGTSATSGRIGSYSGTGSESERSSDSSSSSSSNSDAEDNGVSTKYAI